MKKYAAALLVLALSSTPRIASAFCGFYVGGADAKLFNNATQVVLMREGTRTVLSMQNNYEGPPSNFAMVVPVPVVLQKENVKTLPKDIFGKVDNLAAPRLVEYWEQDPCYQPRYDESPMGGAVPMTAAPAAQSRTESSLGVKIEAQFTVGEYEIVILSAKDSGGLDTWLRQQKYAIPAGAEPYLRPYVQSGSKFFVAKVDANKVSFEKGMAMLSPLRFHYDSESFQLPVRLGLMNAKGPQDLIVHVLARGQRYEVANYPNVTIPTNYDVTESAKAQFGTFYAALFDETVKRHPKAVVTEYSWDASTCDPCPGPALSPADFATLGADALAPSEPAPPPPPRVIPMPGPPRPQAPPKPGSPKAPPVPNNKPVVVPGRPPMAPPPRFFGGFTITRLHARYTKESLGDDLVFRAAAPIVGGREFMGADGKLEHGSQPAQGVNNFQGRYAVRHPWTGPVACEHPQRGIWGGPPGHPNYGNGMGGGGAPPVPAKDTAFAPRGTVQLASFMRSDVPELSVVAQGAPVSPVASPSAPDAEAPALPPDAGVTPAPGPPPEAKDGGCAGCAVGSDGGGAASLGLVGLTTLLVAARTRRRKR